LTTEDRRKGAHAVNRPEGLALRLIRLWPDSTPETKAVVRSMLRPLIAPQPESEAGEAA
jgi:hypothetical protein